MVDFRFDDFIKNASRRSPVLAQHGAVASSQPLATMAGIQILQKGGNAADAAVATAAALNVTEPMSTGLGGDCFCLFYDTASRKVSGLNGSGRAPAGLDIDVVRAAGITGDAIPASNPFSVTIPGSAAGAEHPPDSPPGYRPPTDQNRPSCKSPQSPPTVHTDQGSH